MKAWINNKEFEFQEGETILHAAKRLGIFIPTLCAYLPLNHTPGTCRVCLVEVTDDRGRGQIVTACTTPLTNGMRVQTRTKRIREMQRWQVAWIFSDHDQDCASCSRHGNCELQDLALYVGLQHNSWQRPLYRKATIGLVGQWPGARCQQVHPLLPLRGSLPSGSGSFGSYDGQHRQRMRRGYCRRQTLGRQRQVRAVRPVLACLPDGRSERKGSDRSRPGLVLRPRN